MDGVGAVCDEGKVQDESMTERSSSVITRAGDLQRHTSLGTSMRVGEYFRSSADQYM